MQLAMERISLAYLKYRGQQPTFRAGRWPFLARVDFEVVLGIKRKGRVKTVFTAFEKLETEVNMFV